MQIIEIRKQKTAKPKSKRYRLELRLSAEVKQIIRDAAMLSSQTMAGFITSSALENARSIIKELGEGK